MGGVDPLTLVEGEPTVKYHSFRLIYLTSVLNSEVQCQVGSLAGAAAS